MPLNEGEIAMRYYKVKRDTEDRRDLIFNRIHLARPKKVDLRASMSPIVDQGQLGSCTANAIVSGLREYLLLQKADATRLSRLFLYWQERNLEGTINEDSGAMIRDGMKVLNQLGVCPELDFPYDITKFTQTPSSTSEEDAAKYKIATYERVVDLEALQVSLAHNLPIVIGFTVYDSFESQEVAATGIVPMPDLARERQLGGHAVCAVGYDDEKQWVIVRNSWGTEWGDKGYCYFPYAMFADKELVSDMWTGQLQS